MKEERHKSANLVQEVMKKQTGKTDNTTVKEQGKPRDTAISNTGSVKDKLALFQNA